MKLTIPVGAEAAGESVLVKVIRANLLGDNL